MEGLHGSKSKRNIWACFQFISLIFFSHKQLFVHLISAVVYRVARPQENLCDTTRGHRAWMCCAHYIACLQFVSDINYIKSQTSIQASQSHFPLWQFWVHVSPHFRIIKKKCRIRDILSRYNEAEFYEMSCREVDVNETSSRALCYRCRWSPQCEGVWGGKVICEEI